MPTNQKTPQDLSKQRDEKCEPLALEMFNIVAKHQPNFSAKDREEVMKCYDPIAKEILELFLSRDLTIGEANYTIKIFMTAFDYTRNLVVQSLQHNFELAQQKLFHASKTDIRLKAVDEALKGETISDEPAEAIPSEEESEEEDESEDDDSEFEPEPPDVADEEEEDEADEV